MENKSYYSDKLSAEKLRQCYQIAPLRVKQYFNAEIQYVLDKIKPSDMEECFKNFTKKQKK